MMTQKVTNVNAFMLELSKYALNIPLPEVNDVVSVDYGDDFFEECTVTSVEGEKKITVKSDRLPEEIVVGLDDIHDLKVSGEMNRVWEKIQNQANPEGVVWSDSAVDSTLHSRLLKHIEELCTNEPIDYHPGSGTIVRDLVHPSLYCYVKGVSKLKRPAPKITGFPIVVKDDWQKNIAHDRFGRIWEESKFQWLATPFFVKEDGKVEIEGYINNLDRNKYPNLYEDLGELFSSAIPFFEWSLGYLEKMDWFSLSDQQPDFDHDGCDPEGELEVVRKSLLNRRLLVITKIASYTLKPNETHEGVWHVEGMSHEHVVATCLFILERDERLEREKLLFQRGYTKNDAGYIYTHTMQYPPNHVYDVVGKGIIPLGSLDTPQGRLIVFPNSHIHKLTNLRLSETQHSPARRTIIVFWLVDPDVEVINTEHVDPQQSSMSHSDAMAYRLELMEERKMNKQKWNRRIVNLCEH